MAWFEVLLIAVGLAMDAFAVTIAAVASGKVRGRRAVLRLAFHFGLFQFMMPVIGWFLGNTVSVYVVAVDHWIAFGLLLIVGLRMVRSGMRGEDGAFSGEAADGIAKDSSRGFSLIALSVATSIDALAVGLSLAVVRVGIWQISVAIGVVTFILSMLGAFLGRKLGMFFGRKMEMVGGVILILIGCRILIAHLWFG